MLATDYLTHGWTLGLAGVANVLAIALLWVVYGERLMHTKQTIRDLRADNAKLRDALNDRRFDPGERRNRAAGVNDWAAPTQPRRVRRRAGLTWPGDNSGHLPDTYGHTLAPEPAPLTPVDDLSWLWEDDTTQSYPPLPVEALLVERLIAAAQLEPQTWTAPTLQLQAVR